MSKYVSFLCFHCFSLCYTVQIDTEMGWLTDWMCWEVPSLGRFQSYWMNWIWARVAMKLRVPEPLLGTTDEYSESVRRAFVTELRLLARLPEMTREAARGFITVVMATMPARNTELWHTDLVACSVKLQDRRCRFTPLTFWSFQVIQWSLFDRIQVMGFLVYDRLQSPWTHLIIPSWNFVEVRWRSLFRSASLGKRCTSYNAPPTSRKPAGDRLSLRNFLPQSSMYKGGTSKKRPSPHLHKVPTRSNKLSPQNFANGPRIWPFSFIS
jgi:hypothetical protein